MISSGHVGSSGFQRSIPYIIGSTVHPNLAADRALSFGIGFRNLRYFWESDDRMTLIEFWPGPVGRAEETTDSGESFR